MGVAPLHWELRKKNPDFMILPQNCLNYHKKSSDTLGNEVHTQQQPATRVCGLGRISHCTYFRIWAGSCSRSGILIGIFEILMFCYIYCCEKCKIYLVWSWYFCKYRNVTFILLFQFRYEISNFILRRTIHRQITIYQFKNIQFRI